MKSQVFKYSQLLCNDAFYFIRKYGTKVRLVAELPLSLQNHVETKVIKPKHHPGIIKTLVRSLPPEIEKAIRQAIGDTPIKQLMSEGERFNSYLTMRHLPMEQNEMNDKRTSILKDVEEKLNFDKAKASEEELKHHNEVVNSKVTNILKQRIYNWKSIDYTSHMSLVYLLSRGLSDFFVLIRVFRELQQQAPEFQPKTIFDFGSGVGTVIWAAEETWKKSVEEYYCVDTSSHMCDLSRQIIENSKCTSPNKVFHRQFLPATHDRKYDIVISAYSLMELPNIKTRLETLLNLWQKTKQYLILVEKGSNANFKLINEARDFILMNSKDEEANTHFAHIVAPCPHEFSCPRFETDHTPCNFIVQYEDKFKKGEYTSELFTFIIIAKGRRKKTDEQWPRIVRPVLCRSRHAVCKFCTNSGKLELVTFSPTKPNKATYRCAKASKWGDTLPVEIKYVTKTDPSSSSSDQEENEQPKSELPNLSS